MYTHTRSHNQQTRLIKIKKETNTSTPLRVTIINIVGYPNISNSHHSHIRSINYLVCSLYNTEIISLSASISVRSFKYPQADQNINLSKSPQFEIKSWSVYKVVIRYPYNRNTRKVNIKLNKSAKSKKETIPIRLLILSIVESGSVHQLRIHTNKPTTPRQAHPNIDASTDRRDGGNSTQICGGRPSHIYTCGLCTMAPTAPTRCK